MHAPVSCDPVHASTTLPLAAEWHCLPHVHLVPPAFCANSSTSSGVASTYVSGASTRVATLYVALSLGLANELSHTLPHSLTLAPLSRPFGCLVGDRSIVPLLFGLFSDGAPDNQKHLRTCPLTPAPASDVTAIAINGRCPPASRGVHAKWTYWGACMQMGQSLFYASVTPLLIKQWMFLPKGASFCIRKVVRSTCLDHRPNSYDEAPQKCARTILQSSMAIPNSLWEGSGVEELLFAELLTMHDAACDHTQSMMLVPARTCAVYSC
jgi:hypothetical protein